MLFMVIETFPHGIDVVGARFRERGRMMPEGVSYVASWIDADGARCFQVMEAPDRAALSGWTRNWDDLVDFEVVLVESSADFWARRRTQEEPPG